MDRAYLEYLLFGRTVLNFPKTPKNAGIMANAVKDMPAPTKRFGSGLKAG